MAHRQHQIHRPAGGEVDAKLEVWLAQRAEQIRPISQGGVFKLEGDGPLHGRMQAPPAGEFGRTDHLHLGRQLLGHRRHRRKQLQLARGRARNQEQGTHCFG